MVILLHVVCTLLSRLKARPPAPLLKIVLRCTTSASAAVGAAAASCNRQFVGGVVGVLLMCIGSFSNSFVESEASVAFHAHVVAGARILFAFI
jgi:hypothetical protein